ncbi:MAG: hypothetical protein E6248_00690 [Clostridium sp.]|uniref:hypothetical protein n=1 Tax=Clostridium sp. TaxID=1506 RepID=UPI0029077163|nr:hypothetical protein [Clostridium sp.]MDU5108934.1 hypothetical protein [Clostridium sp.]
MTEKNIYEILNNINVEIPTEEIPLSEVESKRIKKNVKKKVISNKRKYLIVALIFLSFTFIISPLGRDVIAKIKEKLVFSPSLGIISVDDDKELYMLKEPFTVSIKDKEMMVKSIINNGEGLFIQLVGEGNSINAKEITSNISVKLSNGEVKNYDSHGINIGSGRVIIELGIDIRNVEANNFTLMYEDSVLKYVILEKADYKYNYNEIGGNSVNNGILIGGTSYYIQNQRYFKLWSDESSLLSKDYNVNLDIIEVKEVTDEAGNLLRFEHSNEGAINEYKLLDEYDGKINVVIENLELGYNLKNPTKIILKDPDKNGDYSLNKELSFKGIEEKINLTEVKKVGKDIVVGFKFSDYAESDRFIRYITDTSKATSGMSDRENMYGENDIDYEDLTFIEKLTGNIKLNINELDIVQKGKWEFTID